MPKVRWVMLCGFCSKFHKFFSSAKKLKISQDLTKLQRVERWELFEIQCRLNLQAAVANVYALTCHLSLPKLLDHYNTSSSVHTIIV